MEVNKEQNKAICHGDGPMMVLAGPGSGKTFVITRRIRYLLTELSVPPEEILVITFTKAAAEEMQERFYKLMECRQLPVTFGTFHAIYFHIIKRAYHLEYSNIITEKEKRNYMKETLDSFSIEWLDESYTELLLSEISRIKNDSNDPGKNKAIYLPKDLFPQIFYRYEQTKKYYGKIDFDDMVILCKELFLKDPETLSLWRKKFQYILVDEFQDINSMQYEVIRLLASPCNNLFIVGDDDQSIYGFRGSKPAIMLHFKKDYPGAKQVLLGTNYRSTSEIVTMAVSFIENNGKRYQKKLEAAKEGKNNVVCQGFSSKTEEAEAIVNIIKAFGEENNWRDAAVIYRTNAGAHHIVQKFIKAGIPFWMKEKVSNPFSGAVFLDIKAILSFAHGENTRKNILRFANKPIRYLRRELFTEPRVNLEEIKKRNDIPHYVKENVKILCSDINLIKSLPPYGAITYILKGMGYEKYLVKESKGNRKKIQDNLEMTEWLLSISKEQKNFREWEREMEEMEEKLIQSMQESQDKEGVILTTMHGSKGLEFKMVIIPDINEGNIPQGKADTKEELEEERRVFYVAMTRAKEKLYLLYVKQTKENRLVKSRFLSQIKNLKE